MAEILAGDGVDEVTWPLVEVVEAVAVVVKDSSFSLITALIDFLLHRVFCFVGISSA